jgi:ribosomal protein S18 acetylase RimI-like enzyme
MKKEPNISLRDATEKDTEFARVTHHTAYRDVIIKQFGSWDDKLQDKFFYVNWNNPGFKIINLNGNPCGYTRIEYLPNQVEGHELVISPDCQSRGIGTFILHNLIEEARKRDVPAKLQVFTQNRAIELYNRMGFSEIDRNDNHIIMEWRPE